MHIAQSTEAVVDQDAIVNLASARKRWNRETARAVITAWRTSGETARAFCASRGFPVKRLENWVTKLRREEQQGREAPTREEIVFAPVQVVDAPVISEPVIEQSKSIPGRIEVIFSTGVRLILPEQFDASSVRILAEVFGC